MIYACDKLSTLLFVYRGWNAPFYRGTHITNPQQFRASALASLASLAPAHQFMTKAST